MQRVDWNEIRARTIALYARRRPGTSSDDLLPPALTEAQVHQAEKQFGVTFPDDYRQYLLTVSAGGRVRTLRLGQTGWHWDGDTSTQHANLHLSFPDHDTALAACEEIWSKEPQYEDYTSTAAYQAAHDMWEETAEAAGDARTAGAIFLCDDGCGFYTLLVVSGPMRGTMWFDGRATCDRLNPLLNDAGKPATFGEWYLDWLKHEEPLVTTERRQAAYRLWRAGIDTPIWFRWFES